jgi:hypothetical protein
MICAYLTDPTYDTASDASIRGNEDGSKFQGGKIKTMDADGFTITWTKGSTPASATLSFSYLAVR